jgi:hypothetical protein
MDMNRNQYFMAGLVILLMGVQFRMLDSVTLNKECSQFIHRKLNKKDQPASGRPHFAAVTTWGQTKAVEQVTELRTIRPPKWLGFALLSVGAVLALHSLAMPKPE